VFQKRKIKTVRTCGKNVRKTVKNVFKNTLEGKRSVGKPRKRWLFDIKVI
jgi:hypothetical protein